MSSVMLKEMKLINSRLIFLLLSIVLVLGCGEKEQEYISLSQNELARLSDLQEKTKALSMRRDEYKKEEARIEELEESYFDKHMELVYFSVYKSSAFNDGLERACYTGTLRNNGQELVSKVDVMFTFYSDDKGREINRWKTSFVSANDDFLSSGADLRTKSLILAVSGTEYPLKPKESRNLSENKSCMRESFPDWKPENISFEVLSVELRPKMTKFDELEYAKVRSEQASLERRAKAHNQI